MVRPSLRVIAYVHCTFVISSFLIESFFFLQSKFFLHFSLSLSLRFYSSSYKRRRELQLRKDKMSNPLSHGFGSPNKAALLPGAVLLNPAG